MPSERVAVAVLCLALFAVPLAAQDALSGIGPGTEVRSIEFRFRGEHALEETDLRPHIALTARGGMVGIRRVLSFIPFITRVGEHPFRPIELQRDVVRLRHIYIRNGYLQAKVDYDVRYDAEDDLVNVAFVIEEGPPIQLRTVRFTSPDIGAGERGPAG